MEPALFLSGEGDQRRTLVVVFLRGAADGLSLVVPVRDDDYHRARTFLRITPADAVMLDGFFGLNPLLKPLHRAYQDGQLAIVHAAGSEDETRSHFEAQDLMEHGGIVAGGWLGRFLRYGGSTSARAALAALALGRTMPESLRGAPAATALESLEQFSLGSAPAALTAQLQKLYAAQTGPLATAGHATLAALDRIEVLRRTPYAPANGADYGSSGFGFQMQQTARLIKARVGLEAVALDLSGWDSHFTQMAMINPLMQQLGEGLSAFAQDMGAGLTHVSVVVMTEFGRRVQENSSFGTDHGRGSVMFVLGGGAKGGRVVGGWPGLKPDVLEGPGDLVVTHNYRDVLAPVLRRHGADAALGMIFPDFKSAPLDL
ncbi:MAG: DUF1501 domain-containing protein [Alphaproteobacteria bacterium]|nr:DUF1501 domain-containing protein [Alphaproteobacteria bacterium]